MSLILCLALVVALIPAFFVQANAVEENFEFELNEDGKSYSVTSIYSDTKKAELVIPEEYEGLPVTAVKADSVNSICVTVNRISSITIPKTIEYYDVSNFKSPFIGYIVDEENEWFSSENGVLYNKDKTVLFRCPKISEVTEFVLPETVKEISDYAFYNTKKKYASEANSIIRNVVLPEGLEIIGDYAFAQSEFLGFRIPDTVTEIGDFAFDSTNIFYDFYIGANLKSIGKGALKGVNTNVVIEISEQNENFVMAQNGLYNTEKTELFMVTRMEETFVFVDTLQVIRPYVFYDNYYTKNCVFPASLVEIGDYAFYNSGLEGAVSFGNNLEKIGEYAFYNCNLTSVITPSSLKMVGSSAFKENTEMVTLLFNADVQLDFIDVVGTNAYYLKNLSLPDSVTEIDFLSNFPNLESVVLGKNVTSIPAQAFRYNRNLKSVNIPEAVVEIEEYAFEDCVALSAITIPDGVKEIKPYTFCNCGITKISLGDSIETIGEGAFERCSIQEIVLPNSVTSIGERAFNYSSVARVLLSESLTELPYLSFGHCSNLEYIKILSNIKKVGLAAFFGCENLVTVVFSDGVEEIGGSAFEKCYKLENVELPSTLKTIGKQAFYGCQSITDIVLNEGLEVIMDEAFYGCSFSELNIPASVKEFELGSYFFDLVNLKAVNVAEDNTVFCSKDGVLFSKDGTTLLVYPNQKAGVSYTVPHGTQIVEMGSFKTPVNLEEIIFPDTVTTIRAHLNQTPALKRLYIPDSVTEVISNMLGATTWTGPSEAVIYCDYGSYIHSFALENDLNYVVKLNDFLSATSESGNADLREADKLIYTSQFACDDISSMFVVEDGYFIETENSFNNFCGTGTVVTIKDYDNNAVAEYTLIVKGDVNGDSVCDVIDAMIVYNESVETTGFFTPTTFLAADLSENAEITFDDFQAVVNRCLGE